MRRTCGLGACTRRRSRPSCLPRAPATTRSTLPYARHLAATGAGPSRQPPPRSATRPRRVCGIGATGGRPVIGGVPAGDRRRVPVTTYAGERRRPARRNRVYPDDVTALGRPDAAAPAVDVVRRLVGRGVPRPFGTSSRSLRPALPRWPLSPVRGHGRRPEPKDVRNGMTGPNCQQPSATALGLSPADEVPSYVPPAALLYGTTSLPHIGHVDHPGPCRDHLHELDAGRLPPDYPGLILDPHLPARPPAPGSAAVRRAHVPLFGPLLPGRPTSCEAAPSPPFAAAGRGCVGAAVYQRRPRGRGDPGRRLRHDLVHPCNVHIRPAPVVPVPDPRVLLPRAYPHAP